jgi:hypothetical protein
MQATDLSGNCCDCHTLKLEIDERAWLRWPTHLVPLRREGLDVVEYFEHPDWTESGPSDFARITFSNRPARVLAQHDAPADITGPMA